MPHILFLSTHNLASNPRLVKEIQLALDNGFTIEVICFRFRNWSDEINTGILNRFREQAVQFHCIEAGREGGVSWFKAVLKEKYYRLVSKGMRIRGRALATAVSRRNSLLLKAIKNIQQADWVIGHNPGAMYATKYAAQQLHAKAGFDVEDYHPGEGQHLHVQNLTRQLMQEVLPVMDYVSFAAPLIREAVKNDLGKEGANWLTVLNYFPAAEFVAPKNVDGPLRLVWFSQNISAGRGLETFLPALKSFTGEMELHLFGNLDERFYHVYLRNAENVILHNPIPQKELHSRLSIFDIGLALEPKKDLNNDLAISNKLLAYLQAGLFILASETAGQKQLIKQYPQHGLITSLKPSDLERTLQNMLVNKNRNKAAATPFKNGNIPCWESEARVLEKVWSASAG